MSPRRAGPSIVPPVRVFNRTSGFELSVATARDMMEKFTSHRPLAGLKVLDVGCRNGESVRALTDLGAAAFGVDVAQRCVEHAKRRFPELADRYAQADLRNLTGLGEADFDLVTCVGVLPYTPSSTWLASLAGMARLCNARGEVRVLLQREKPLALTLAVRGLSRIPEPLYARVAAPVVTAGVWPLSRWLLGAQMRPAEVHYRVSLSLYGLTFGVPGELLPFEVPVEASAYVSPALSRAFALPAGFASTIPIGGAGGAGRARSS